MTQKPSIPPQWVEQLQAFKAFASSRELAAAHPPPHKRGSEEMEIWHYPLGIAGGTLYAIHVAVSGNDAPMVYMAVEPSDLPDTAVVPKRPWWRFW